MHVKCLPHGRGSARVAVDYLVGERDAEGHRREGVEVLRGNPDMVAAVADSLEFERKYTSVVIAWAPDDRPTDAQIEAVLDEFERTAWAGLEPDRYSWTAVLHRERGGVVGVDGLGVGGVTGVEGGAGGEAGRARMGRDAAARGRPAGPRVQRDPERT